MRNVAVFTGTRAEYGLLYWLMKEIDAHPRLSLQVIVAAMHLSPEFGKTSNLIECDGFSIDAKVEMLLSSNTGVGVAKSIGLGVISLADALDRLKPHVIVILGDRFEALAAAQTALMLKIPILHVHGGEVTEGAYDDAIRHAITKMAMMHAVAAEPYRQRVIQMGEDPQRVVNTGALGLDHVKRSPRLSREALAKTLHFSLERPFFLVTYHPETLADVPALESLQTVLTALDEWPDYQVILTYPNADEGGREMIGAIEAYSARQPHRVMAVPSLGSQRYHSALAECAVVIGNSSSGIIEAPSFLAPTVNIGQRQAGRLAAASVVNCDSTSASIRGAIQHALSPEVRSDTRRFQNPYGQGDAAGRIMDMLLSMPLTTIKRFHDYLG
ncbi:UDP-N-acetylglucosamine 2-epimerase [Halomonas sp. PAMB 3264]|uniref:UDP-N-acetylglucosamine 2-epimerase n=1 Tax=Halomonas sp. PAMB 3264 TaxID=3075222 RepID=UPI0028A12167|nr:UDP-N-acetylglucosamine 2-epimerase [Halomonas sp. PAMB 3264]WNL41793.1 UDP-N-acetylglucosamine 2-epimerase [Halomonas sp. PAMB 3264]